MIMQIVSIVKYVRSNWTKWSALFLIYFQEGLAYRASGLIWVVTDLTTAVTMPLVWAAASRNGPIAGYKTGDFVLYYLCILMVGSFVTSHLMWDIAIEVREGVFSSALLRPISYFQLSFIRNITWRLFRPILFLPFFLMLLVAYRPFLLGSQLHLDWKFWLSLLLGHLVSFNFVMAMSMISLFVQEATAIFELYYLPLLFLSGTVFPIAVLPPWVKVVSNFTPFYYTTGGCTEILIGRVTDQRAISIILTQIGWVLVSFLAFRLLWSKGIKQYSGVGM